MSKDVIDSVGHYETRSGTIFKCSEIVPTPSGKKAVGYLTAPDGNIGPTLYYCSTGKMKKDCRFNTSLDVIGKIKIVK